MISFVIPVFNMEQYLPRCMESLIKQKGDFEIILVNDGSTDGSMMLCDQYALKYPDLVRVIHKENGGLSSARNTGIDAARGEYVIFPDPDDWVEENLLERLMELQEKFQCDLLCIGHYVDLDTYSVPINVGQSLQQMDRLQAQRALLIPPCFFGFAWNKLYHLDIIRMNDLRFMDDVGTTEDLDFAFRYLKFCKKIVFSPEDRLYHYYQHNNAATHSGFSRHKINSIHTYEKIIASSKDCLELICAANEEICNVAINLLWLYRSNQCDDIEAEKKLKKYLKQTLRCYLNSKRYGVGRKIQAIMAYISPSLYCIIKNILTKG